MTIEHPAAHRRERPREETEARLLRERGTPEERIGPVVPDGTLYPQPESSAATVVCPTCKGGRYVEKLGLRGFKVVECPTCKGVGRV